MPVTHRRRGHAADNPSPTVWRGGDQESTDCRWEAPRVARNNLHPLPRHELARDRSGAAASDAVVREGVVARSTPRPAPAGAAVPGGRGARTASHPAREAAAALASAVPSKLRATRNRRLQRPLDECFDHTCASLRVIPRPCDGPTPRLLRVRAEALSAEKDDL